MIKLGIAGACGRMGQRIIALAKEDNDFSVAFGLEKSGHSDIGKIVNEVSIIDDFSTLEPCDCFIDFTLPVATVEHLRHLVKIKKPVVIGTTGIDDASQEIIRQASTVMPIVFSPNMSVGVNLLFRLLKEASGILKDYKVEIKEAHHIHKKDSPSGTAKKIAQIITDQGFDIKIEDIEAIREDEIVGDHKVTFESDVDKIELFHSAKTRDIFAKGALLAAKWVVNKPAGLYSMDDVLFGNKS